MCSELHNLLGFGIRLIPVRILATSGQMPSVRAHHSFNASFRRYGSVSVMRRRRSKPTSLSMVEIRRPPTTAVVKRDDIGTRQPRGRSSMNFS
jgi:hypothetical protein